MNRSRSKKDPRKNGKPVSTPGPPERLQWGALLIVAVVAFLAFAHTIPYDFVFDDQYQVLRNPWIRDWSRINEIFTSNVWQFTNPSLVTNYYRPIHLLLHMLGYALSGMKPYAYHVINITLHCLSAILVSLVAFRVARDRLISYAAGLIFALHPIHSESVTWIAAVTDLSCAVFYFAAVYFYAKDQESPSRRVHFVLALVTFFLALLSKEMAFTFPLVAAALDWALRGKFRWSRYASMTVVFVVYLAMRLNALSVFSVGDLPAELGLWSLILSTFVVFSQYLVKLFIPHDIHAFHVFFPTQSIFSGEFLIASVIVAVFGLVLWLLRAQRKAFFALAFGILTIVPLLHISALGEYIFADRYLYIPSLGAALLIPLAGKMIGAKRFAGLSGWHVGGGFLFLLLFAYGFQISKTTFMWRDNRTLYVESLKRSPNATFVASQLANDLYQTGQYDEARAWYQKSLELWDKTLIKNKSTLSGIYNGLGGVYLKQSKLDQAKDYFIRASQLTPGSFLVLQNLGSVSLAMDEREQAMKYYKRALEINPRSEWSYNNLAVAYLYQANFDEAIRMAQKALDIFPRLGEAYLVMAKAHTMTGHKAEALRALSMAVQVDPSKAALVEKERRAIETTGTEGKGPGSPKASSGK